MKEIIWNLKEGIVFKWIWWNMKSLGFWKWLALEFNNGWYVTHSFKWLVFLKSMFNYFIGHPFLGFGIASISVVVFGMASSGVLLPIFLIVLAEEARQFFWQQKAGKWWPVDTLADIATWLAGGLLFQHFYL